MKKFGVRCEVKLIKGGTHLLYSFQDGASPLRDETLKDCEAFLRSIDGFTNH